MKTKYEEELEREIKNCGEHSRDKTILEAKLEGYKLAKEEFDKFIEELKSKKITLIHHGDEGTSCFVDAVRFDWIDRLKGEMGK